MQSKVQKVGQPSMDSSHHLWFWAFERAALGPNLQVSIGPQTSPVILCMQNSVPRIRITGLCGSQPSSVVFACKTA